MLPSVNTNASGIWGKFLLQKFTPIQHVLKRYSVNTHIFATANDRRGYCKVSMLFRTTYVN